MARFDRGFTLVEVLVALVIVAMAIPALLMRIGNMATTTMHTKEVAIAYWVAENHLAEIHITRQLQRTTPTGRMADDVRMAGEVWDRVVETEPTPLPGMLRLRVSVRAQGGETDLVELSGFILEQ